MQRACQCDSGGGPQAWPPAGRLVARQRNGNRLACYASQSPSTSASLAPRSASVWSSASQNCSSVFHAALTAVGESSAPVHGTLAEMIASAPLRDGDKSAGSGEFMKSEEATTLALSPAGASGESDRSKNLSAVRRVV